MTINTQANILNFIAVLDTANIAYKFKSETNNLYFLYMSNGDTIFDITTCNKVIIDNKLNLSTIINNLTDEITKMNIIINIRNIKKSAIEKLQLTFNQEELDVLGIDITKLKN